MERDVYRNRLADAIVEFDFACDNVPPEWWWEGDGVPTNFNRDAANETLNRFTDDIFWRIA